MEIKKIPNQIITQPLQPNNLGNIDAIGLHHMAHPTWGVKDVENYHVRTLGWRAIGYNYWVGLDGTVYEGRGLNLGAGVENQNGHIISIGCQGDYHTKPTTMPKAQHDAVMELCRWLLAKVPTIKMIKGHGAYMATDCPGRYFPVADFAIDRVRSTTAPAAAPPVVEAKYYKAVVVPASQLHIAMIDDTVRPFDNMINGGYFGTQKDGATYPTSLLYQELTYICNKPTHCKPVGTLLIYKDGRAVIMPVDDLRIHNRYNDLRVAISGMSILPYRQTDEGFIGAYADVARNAPRSMLGVDGKGNVVIVCHKGISAANGGDLMRTLGCTDAITLDGGGSTCMRVGGVDYMYSSRRINSVVWW